MEIGLLPELIAINIAGQKEEIKSHELLNIEIQTNKERFLSYFDKILEEKDKYMLRNKN